MCVQNNSEAGILSQETPERSRLYKDNNDALLLQGSDPQSGPCDCRDQNVDTDSGGQGLRNPAFTSDHVGEEFLSGV